jgi:aryl carrier-like protein
LALKQVTSSTECSNIGYPFGLNKAYVLDERLRPTPLGCVGELFIAGPQVARGYLNDPERTSKVFIDNPFHPGSIMYATGDLVRMNPSDGSIHYLGRRDSQIKIRGLRIELEEIEAVLKGTAETITNAAVLKLNIEREILVAFLEYPSNATAEDEMMIVLDGVGPLVASLRYAVRRKLPSYMAPTIYVTLNRFPLTSSGKLDRKALDEYFHSHERAIRDMERDTDGGTLAYPHAADPHGIPQTELQATIRHLWASVLHIDEELLSMEDDFYSVGGDSISAIHLARAARVSGLHLPVIDIIRNPTIRAMASISGPRVLNDDDDDDDTMSMNLAEMTPHDLTLLDVDDVGLNRLKDELLDKHGLSPR